MRTLRYISVFLPLLYLSNFPAVSQNWGVGLSVSPVVDRDWNKSVNGVSLVGFPILSATSRVPVNLGLNGEYNFTFWSVALGTNALIRRIEVYPYKSIDHRTIEIPLTISYKTKVGLSSRFILGVGPSLDLVISPTQQVDIKIPIKNAPDSLPSYYSVFWRFVKPDNVIWALNANIGLNASLGKAGSLTTRLQYHYQLSKGLEYQFQDYFGIQSSKYKANYLMLGVIYYPPLFKRKEDDGRIE